MIQLGKTNVLGISVDVMDYEAAVRSIVQAARDRKLFPEAHVRAVGFPILGNSIIASYRKQ